MAHPTAKIASLLLKLGIALEAPSHPDSLGYMVGESWKGIWDWG